MTIKIVLWTMIAIQMVAWAWIQSKGGKLSDKNYLIFCAMMMTGQTAAAIECLVGKVWGTLAIQVFFFVFTAFGGIQRYRRMKRSRNHEISTLAFFEGVW